RFPVQRLGRRLGPFWLQRGARHLLFHLHLGDPHRLTGERSLRRGHCHRYRLHLLLACGLQRRHVAGPVAGRGHHASAVFVRWLERRDDVDGARALDERVDASLTPDALWSSPAQSTLKRSSRTSFVRRLAPPASSLSTLSTRSFFFCLSSRIFSSIVPPAIRR